MKKGVEFEKEIISFLKQKHHVVTISQYYNVDKVHETISNMKKVFLLYIQRLYSINTIELMV